MASSRTFELVEAKAEGLWLCVGIIGPSKSGKTFSALRLAEGMRRVSGGDIAVIDTEAGRAKHYARKFRFKHLSLTEPFSPSDYLQAIRYCYSKGARTIIVDSMSHEHEGEGGVLEMHEAELQRMGGNEKNSFRAWAKPKMEHQRLKNAVLQMEANFIFCFRAKEKVKPDKNADNGLKQLGWQPIGDIAWMYEMTMCCLLLPMCDGVPEWRPVELDSKKLIGVPEQFRPLFFDANGNPLKKPLSEYHGEIMKRWATGRSTEQAIADAKEAHEKRTATQEQPKPSEPKPAAEDDELRGRE